MADARLEGGRVSAAVGVGLLGVNGARWVVGHVRSSMVGESVGRRWQTGRMIAEGDTVVVVLGAVARGSEGNLFAGIEDLGRVVGQMETVPEVDRIRLGEILGK